MTETYVWGDLDWHRDARTGVYRATPEDSVLGFRAVIQRGTGEGNHPAEGWRVSTYTDMRPLDFATARTLAEAKAAAERTYRNVEPAARGEG